MDKNNLMVLILALLIIGITWWFAEDMQEEKKGNLLSNLYSFGTLFPYTQSGALGCTDSEAENYNSAATIDNGECIYKFGCCDVAATNYDPEADSCHRPNNNALTCSYGGNGHPYGG